MDHMIRDAAENHHPAYNDQAWEKMEKMLDKHLPQKRDRRKYFFFLLLFLLLGGGALFSVYKLGESNSKQSIGVSAKEDNLKKEVDKTSTPVTDEQDNSDALTSSVSSNPAGNPGLTKGNTTSSTGITSVNTTSIPKRNKTVSGKGTTLKTSVEDQGQAIKKYGTRSNRGRSDIRTIAGAIGNRDLAITNSDSRVNNRSPYRKKGTGKTKVTIAPVAAEEAEKKETGTEPLASGKEETKNTEVTSQPVAVNEQPMKAEEKKEETKQKEEKKEEITATNNKPPSAPDKKKPGKGGFRSNFGITFSVGPDVSFVSLNKLGKATITYGAGISYTFAKQRLTARAGFYTSNKIYDATPEQYHTPGGNYPYLFNVAAECRVYEIPLALSYNFWNRKKHSWFGSIGLSSFLMKTEKYNYEYKTPSGQYYNYPWKVKDENKHYFSVVTLSAGYNYKLSKRISLQAEPYVKIPLGGVGHGKVKLNSGGILFTVTVKPFAKKD